MNVNLVEQASWTTVLDPVASGTGTSLTAGVDMQFFTSAVFALVLGSVDEGAEITFNIQRSTVSGFTDAEDIGTVAALANLTEETGEGEMSGGLDTVNERLQATATSGNRQIPIPSGTIGKRQRATLMSTYGPHTGVVGTFTNQGLTYLLDATNPPGRFRYLRAKVVRSTASSQIAGVYCLQYAAMRRPVEQSSDVENTVTRPAMV